MTMDTGQPFFILVIVGMAVIIWSLFRILDELRTNRRVLVEIGVEEISELLKGLDGDASSIKSTVWEISERTKTHFPTEEEAFAADYILQEDKYAELEAAYLGPPPPDVPHMSGEGMSATPRLLKDLRREVRSIRSTVMDISDRAKRHLPTKEEEENPVRG